MRTINVVFEGKEYKRLVKLKGKRSWYAFILGFSEIKKGLGDEERIGGRSSVYKFISSRSQY